MKEHCKSVGRDYDSILKTRLSPTVIGDDKEMAKKRLLQNSKGMDEAVALSGAVYGTPEDVSAQIEILKDAGKRCWYSVSYSESRPI